MGKQDSKSPSKGDASKSAGKPKDPAQLKALMKQYQKKKESLNSHLDAVKQLNHELLEMHKELREAQGTPRDVQRRAQKQSSLPPIKDPKGGQSKFPKTAPARTTAAEPRSKLERSESFPPPKPPHGEPWPDPPQRHKGPGRRVQPQYGGWDQQKQGGRMINDNDPTATQKVAMMQMRMEGLMRK